MEATHNVLLFSPSGTVTKSVLFSFIAPEFLSSQGAAIERLDWICYRLLSSGGPETICGVFCMGMER